MKHNWKSTLLWSVIAAAFVGPGTVTTATKAGSEGGWYYVIPLFLAISAGYLLMEMAARLTLVTQQSLGHIVRNALGETVVYLLFGAVLLGCAAYQAGNLVGGFGGLQLFAAVDRLFILLPVLAILAILLFGNIPAIGRLLAAVVLLMGLAFLFTGSQVTLAGIDMETGTRGLKAATILSLIGTTIVPYNFFLASGLSPGQSLGQMRSGLFISFLVGGLITLGILLTGSIITEFQDFASLATVLDAKLGSFGPFLLGLGLFAAGFSSAITAPLAAAVAGKTLLAHHPADHGWSTQGNKFRMVWFGVLTIGVVVAMLDLNIVAVILAAQLVNGLLVPFLAALMLYLANDQHLLGQHINKNWQNGGGLLVFAYVAYQSCMTFSAKLFATPSVWVALFLSGLLTLLLARQIVKQRQ